MYRDFLVSVGAIGGGFPRVPGHEIVGDIVSAHPSVTSFKVGQRVGAGWQRGFCDMCRYCGEGRHMGCESLTKFTTGTFISFFFRDRTPFFAWC